MKNEHKIMHSIRPVFYIVSPGLQLRPGTRIGSGEKDN